MKVLAFSEHHLALHTPFAFVLERDHRGMPLAALPPPLTLSQLSYTRQDICWHGAAHSGPSAINYQLRKHSTDLPKANLIGAIPQLRVPLPR